MLRMDCVPYPSWLPDDGSQELKHTSVSRIYQSINKISCAKMVHYHKFQKILVFDTESIKHISTTIIFTWCSLHACCKSLCTAHTQQSNQFVLEIE